MIGLKNLVAAGWQLYDAVDSMSWPGSAAVTIAIVNSAHGLACNRTSPCLNGMPVHAINTQLQPRPERNDSLRLACNKGLGIQGVVALGMGFVLSEAERVELIARSASNAACIRPYIGGEEVNTNPSQMFERYVIDFGRMDQDAAERWPDLINRIRDRVKPERERLPPTTAWNRDVSRRWWQFAATRPDLVAALAPLSRCLVTAQTAKHYCVSFQPTDRVFTTKLVVFNLDHTAHFAILQSRLKDMWTWQHASTMKTDLSYTSDCFETFPFPTPDPRTVIPELETIGERLYAARATFMVDTNQGLTKTYNALKDPACDDPRILELRRLHEEMDRTVLAAYCWADIPCRRTARSREADREALQAFEDEVIDRLYVLNAERAREEQRLGLGGKKRARGTSDEVEGSEEGVANASADAGANKGGRRKKATEGQGKLF